MIRVFIAIDLPEDVRASLAAAQARLQRSRAGVKVSWTKIESLHLTLQFLGDIEESAVTGISAELTGVAGRLAAFAVPVSGAGAFPDEDRPRVLWIGCHDSTGRLRTLARAVQDVMQPLGFAPEHREFAPHLTLGRIKIPQPDAALTKALESLKDTVFGTLRVETVHLFQSQLHPEGSIYTKLSSHKLKGETSNAAKS